MKLKCVHVGCNKILDTESKLDEEQDYYTALGAGAFCLEHYHYWQDIDDEIDAENDDSN